MQICFQEHKYSAALIGHSFVAGLQQFLWNDKQRAIPIPQFAAHSIKVSNLVESVSFYGERGATVTGIHQILPNTIREDVVLLDIGTNDIVQGTPVQKIADSITQLALRILSLGAAIVCVLSVVPRSSGLGPITKDDFRRRAETLESALKSQFQRIPRVLFKKHKGFYEIECNGAKIPKPTFSWSRDGIHPNRPDNSFGKKLYMNSLRSAIVASVKLLKAHQKNPLQ